MQLVADPWGLAVVLSKALSYFAMASLSGGIFVLWLTSVVSRQSRGGHDCDQPADLQEVLRQLIKLLLVSCVIGILAVLLFFFLQIGLINQAGVAGMFDGLMISVVVQSSVGFGVGLKVTAFAIAGLTLASNASLVPSVVVAGRLPASLLSGWLLSLILFGTSFAMLGHVAGLSPLARIAIALHVVAVCLWTGSLYPLYLLCRTRIGGALEAVLQLFGRIGWTVVAMLGISGIYLLTQLLASVSELSATTYGLLLLCKILLVACLLGLAALNKFRLVPALGERGAGALRNSIRAELGLALLILLITAILTSVTGPVHSS